MLSVNSDFPSRDGREREVKILINVLGIWKYISTGFGSGIFDDDIVDDIPGIISMTKLSFS